MVDQQLPVDHADWIFSGLTLILTLGTSAVLGTWALARNNTKIVESFQNRIATERKEIDEKIDTSRREVDEKIDDNVRELHDRIDDSTHAAGEGLSAMRQKVHEVELWMRDNLVNVKAFEQFSKDVKDALGRVENKIDKSITSKLDALFKQKIESEE